MRLYVAIFSIVLSAINSFAKSENFKYNPFQRDAYLTSSFGENRGTRYHMGLDYSTQMEEGWPVFAPEDGSVIQLKTSPYGYGKAMYFQGVSGKTFVYAHQCSFGKLDTLIYQAQIKQKKNDVTLTPKIKFKKGDTLTFAGSSGIGNPHLHLEVRIDGDRIMSPCKFGAMCLDTIAPQIFGVAVWQKNDLAITNAESVQNGCIEAPSAEGNNLNMAVKIADYSRDPRDNPMSIRRLELWEGEKKIFSKVQDTLLFSKNINIRDELLWTEEADTAGDWHVINAKLSATASYKLEIEDYAGHTTTQVFSLKTTCDKNAPLLLKKNQETPLFTFISRSAIDLTPCDNGMNFSAKDSSGKVTIANLCTEFKHGPTFLGKIIEKSPLTRNILYGKDSILIYPFESTKDSVEWTLQKGNAKISQKISKLAPLSTGEIRTLAVTENHTDSLNFWEFHPKGIQFRGKWDLCIDAGKQTAPLYWLGETGRGWNIFSKQTNAPNRCVSINELRDISAISTLDAPTLGNAYWDTYFFSGVKKPALRIPIHYIYNGIPNGNAINVYNGKIWIPAEYDSEPKEIILEGSKIPPSGQKISIQIVDEAKHKKNFEIIIPDKP